MRIVRVTGLSQPKNGGTFIKHAAAMKIIFLKDLVAKLGTELAELRGQLDQPLFVDPIFFFDLDGHRVVLKQSSILITGGAGKPPQP